MAQLADELGILRIKCKQMKCLRERYIVWLLILIVECLLLMPAVSFFSRILSLVNLISLLIGSIVFINWVMIRFIFYRPGQGDLLLSPNGFQMINHLRRSLEYRWKDVQSFNIVHDGLREEDKRVFCYPQVGKAFCLQSYYEMPSEELLEILYQWKKQHAPDSLEIGSKPEIHPQAVVKPKVDTFQIKASIFALLVLGVWILFFEKTQIFIMNNTKIPIQSILVTGIDPVFKHVQRFEIQNLSPGQEVALYIKHLGKGQIKIRYEDKKSVCMYLERSQCAWKAGERVYIEPNGKLASNNRTCQLVTMFKPSIFSSDKMRDQMVATSCDQINMDSKVKTYDEEDLVQIDPPKIYQPPLKMLSNQKEYLSSIESEINKHWHPPYGLKPWFSKAHFLITKKGEASKLELFQSSNNAEWDKSTLDAIQDAGPFETVPVDRSPSTTLDITFNYYPLDSGHKSKVTALYLFKTDNK